MNNRELAVTAAKARILGMEMVHGAASGHIGGSLSCIDILTALYFARMRVDISDPRRADRDRLVLSKGHCTPALYPILALRGFFPVEELNNFRRIGGHMSGHAEMHYVAGVDMSTGSLGQGISAAVGMALAGKLDGMDYRTYALLGDGEVEEGQVWEAAASAAKYGLDKLCAIVDVNGLQIDGRTCDVMPMEPLDKKFESFGWHVIKADGHDFDSLLASLDAAGEHRDSPSVILAATVKGKGVSFMENNPDWHGKAPGDEDFRRAMAELEARLRELEVQ